MDLLKTYREVFSIIIAIVVSTITAIGWFSSNFVTTALGEEMMQRAMSADTALSTEIKNLAEAVTDSNTLLLEHIEKSRLDAVIEDIRRNEAEVFQIQQFISVNGTNSQADSRLRQLKAEHEDLVLKRDCIISNNRLCDD